MEAALNWKSGLRFHAKTGAGSEIVFDGDNEASDPGPMEGLLTSLAACTAMDVISILEKKRQKVTDYRLEVVGERPPKGVYPRPFTKIVIKHFIEGENVDEQAVARAIELSESKYCSVAITLKSAPEVINQWQVSSREQ
jgi:putative redox protein